MKQSLVTVAVPFDRAKADAVDALLETFIPSLRNSDGAIRAALRRQGIHFMSITVVRGDVGEPTHLMFEMSVDGEETEAFRIVEARLWDPVNTILQTAGIEVPSSLKAFLANHQIRVGQGRFDVPGITFCGTPGISLGRILDEYELARAIRDYLDETTPTGSPLAAVRQIRARIAEDPKLRALLSPEPVNRLPLDSGLTNLDTGLIVTLAAAGLWQFFWPLISVLGVLVAAATGFAGWEMARAAMASGASSAAAIAAGVGAGLGALVTVGILALIVLIIRLAGLYSNLRTLEEANQPDNRVPDRDVLAKVIAQEDWAAHNHLAGISIMQAGKLRRLTLRIAFGPLANLRCDASRRFLGELERSTSRAGSFCPRRTSCCSSRITAAVGKAISRTSSPRRRTALPGCGATRSGFREPRTCSPRARPTANDSNIGRGANSSLRASGTRPIRGSRPHGSG
jgi:hypothetical protein